MDIDPAEINAYLDDATEVISEVNMRSRPGLIRVRLTRPLTLLGTELAAGTILYSGSTMDMNSSDVSEHLNSDRTGKSTLRRSLGAILKDQLQLAAIPRSLGEDDRRHECYRFTPEGEFRLTDWIELNTETHIGRCGATAESVEAIKRAMIEHDEPFSNLTRWDNPNAGTIRELRLRCIQEARGNDDLYRRTVP